MTILLFVILWTLLFGVVLQFKIPEMSIATNRVFSFLTANIALVFALLFSLFFKINFEKTILVFDLLLIFALVRFYPKYRSYQPSITAKQIPWSNSLILYTGLFYFNFWFFNEVKIWGEWDAFSIWSMHAKFLLTPQSFNQLFAVTFKYSHPDYPLFLPALIAAYWKMSNSLSPYAPMLLAYATSIILLSLGFLHLANKRAPIAGVLWLWLLLQPQFLLPFCASQYADTLMALFILASIILYDIATEKQSAYSFLFLGFWVATTAWIKNEGLLFIAVFSLVFTIKNLKQLFILSRYFLGVIIPLSGILYFKLHYCYNSDLFAQNAEQDLFRKICDLSRLNQILDFFREMLIQHYLPIIVLAFLVVIFRIQYFVSFYFSVLFLQFLGYVLIYQITPHPLDWHLSTSADRLLHQLIPAFVLSSLLFIQKHRKSSIVQF